MIDLGSVVPLSITVKDSNDAPANAGNMALTISGPTTATVVDPVAPTDTGVYNYDFTPTEAGLHQVRWLATGANAGAYTDAFNIDPAAATAIVSLAETKAHLNIDSTDTTYDAELRGFIAAASEYVESRIGPVTRRTVVETVIPSGGVLCLVEAPVISLTTVAGAYGYGSTYTVGSLYLDGDAGIVHPGLTSLSFGCYPLTVTYVAGRAVVPAAVQWATKEYVAWLWDTQRGPAQASPAQSDFGDLPSGTFATVPRRIDAALEQYANPVVA